MGVTGDPERTGFSRQSNRQVKLAVEYSIGTMTDSLQQPLILGIKGRLRYCPAEFPSQVGFR